MKLHEKASRSRVGKSQVLRVTLDPSYEGDRSDSVLCVPTFRQLGINYPNGFGAFLSFSHDRDIDPRGEFVMGLESLTYLSEGDVIALNPSGIVRVLYRRASKHNFLFATNNCNSLCLMCSQPPSIVTELERTEEHLRLVALIDPSTPHLGITGGEPTFFKQGFLKVVEECKNRLSKTHLHVLTNGRSFADRGFASELAAIGHPDLTLGIPLYADVDHIHDYVVQAKGAFHETVLGIHNLAELRVDIELRNVLSRVTTQRLVPWAEYVRRNMTFISHVALMGLEMTGFVNRNLDQLWIDPHDYADELMRATLFLSDAGFAVSIYNHPLCVLPREIWGHAVKSISDWKNIYLRECSDCAARTDICGGFFQSASKQHSAYIAAISSDKLKAAGL